MGKRTPNWEDLEDCCLDFKEFCLVDLQLDKNTSYRHEKRIKRYLEHINKDPREMTREDLRTYLLELKERLEPSTYRNELASLKRFYRDFLGMDQLVSTFKFPREGFKPITTPSKGELQRFYRALTTPRDRTLFLMYASSGLRCSEILSLELEDLDLEKRMIMPRKTENESKHVWISFYNEECERELREYLKEHQGSRLFPISKRQAIRIFKKAEEKTGIHVRPQILREWFCCEMGSLGVQDRYVDAFCGRTPKSVLAKHYTDYNPEKLRQIYEKADLRVLS